MNRRASRQLLAGGGIVRFRQTADLCDYHSRTILAGSVTFDGRLSLPVVRPLSFGKACDVPEAAQTPYPLTGFPIGETIPIAPMTAADKEVSMRFKAIQVGALSLFMAAGIYTPAAASPQILGLLASAEPAKLTCSSGVCTAEFSSFCLQQHRKTPTQGTAYVPSDQTRLTVSVTDATGAVRTLPVADKVSVRSLRGYTTVQISVPAGLVASLGKGNATLSVAPHASLVPAAMAGTDDPRLRQEIALYTGPMRRVASASNEREPVNVQAARLMNKMVNDLPANSDLSQAERDAVWEQSVKKHTDHVSTPALAKAATAFRNCRGDYNRYGLNGMRACMGHEHDRSMIDVTREVWQDQKGGS